MSAGAEDALFTDGMHVEMIATLGRIPGLRVISRTSAQRYKDTQLTMAEIGRELNVANVASGSVRRAGNKAENEVRALPNEANDYNRLGSSLSDFGRHREARAAFDRARLDRSLRRAR